MEAYRIHTGHSNRDDWGCCKRDGTSVQPLRPVASGKDRHRTYVAAYCAVVVVVVLHYLV